MGEKEKVKVMLTLTSKTIRELIKQVNEKQIQKEDIVSLLPIREQYVLVYYSK